MRRAELGLCLLLLPGLASAAGDPRVQQLLRTQAQQPVDLRADRAEWRAGGSMSFEGRVRLTSGALNLEGDRLEVRDFGRETVKAEVSGTPARLTHSAQDASPPVSAEARRLTLDALAQRVELSGDARLTRGSESLAGNLLRYDLRARRMLGAGRIRMEVPATAKTP